MDETDFSEDTTYKQQEDLPYDGDFSQMKICNDYNFTSKNDIPDVSVTLRGDDPQEEAAHNETCQNTAMAMTWAKITENAVNKKCDKEKQCTMTLHIPANNRDTSKSNISDILLHHLSKEQFLRGQGIDCETFPETSNVDSVDEAAVIKNIISRYVKNSRPKEQTPEFTDQLSPKWDSENSNKPSCSSSTTEENISGLEEPMASRDSSHEENSNFLMKIKGPSDKQKSCLVQASPRLLTKKASPSTGFKYGQGLVHYQLPDFSKVPPKVKIPKNNIINKPLTRAKQPSFSPKLRNKSIILQDILETMSKSTCVEKQHPEQKRKITETSQRIQMEPTVHTHQELFTGIESDAGLLKLTSTFQKDPSSTSYLFQKLSQGKQMCQNLKEQTDQLKTKLQEFSKRIKQDSVCHLQDKRLVLEQLQGHLEELEQEFLATKDKHLAWQQQILMHESPAVDDFDPKREVEGEIFKLEMLFEDIKEKMDENKYTSALSLPESSPIILDDWATTASSPSNEVQPGLSCMLGCACAASGLSHMQSRSQEDPNSTLGRLVRTEMVAPSLSCAFCCRILERKQKMEKRGHRRINCGRFSIIIHEKAPHRVSTLSSDTGPSFYSDSGTGLQSNKCEDCGTKIPNFQRVSSKEPLKAFYYRYNTPGQKYLNQSESGAFVQPHSLDENKNSSPSCSKPQWICSQKVNSKSSPDECEPTPGKKHAKTFMTYSSDLSTPCRISGSKSLCDFNSKEETESKILNSALDHALKTATILKKTTDQMIKAIAEDLAKAQRWRNRLKY